MLRTHFVLFFAQALTVGAAHAQWADNGFPVCNALNQQLPTALVSDLQGGAFVVWQDTRAPQTGVYAQRVSASGVPLWTLNGDLVGLSGNQQFNPIAAADGVGGFVTALGEGAAIVVQRMDALGNRIWGPNGLGVMSSATWGHDAVDILGDGAGGAFVLWYDDRPGGESGLYAQHLSALGSLMWDTSGVAIRVPFDDVSSPSLALDGAGGVFVAWQDNRGPDQDVYAQRVDAGGAPTWTVNGVPVSAASGHQVSPAIVSDGSGGAILAWGDSRAGGFGNPKKIWGQRVDATGAALWAMNGIPICTFNSDHQINYLHGLVSDEAGGAIVVWEDGRNGGLISADLFAQRVNGAGVTQWVADGAPVCVQPDDQLFWHAVADGSGGILITWWDYRTPASSGDIYAQRIDAGGSPLWELNGVNVCDAAGRQRFPIIAPTPDGGAIVAWFEERGVDQDVYAHRVTPLGVADVRPLRATASLSVVPNPSRSGVDLYFSSASSGYATVTIYDVSGRRVHSAPRKWLETGAQSVHWDSLDLNGSRVGPGVYFAELRLNGRTRTARFLLLE